MFNELVQLVLFCYKYLHYKNETKHTEVVDASNESLYHADEEMHPLLRTFSPSQTIFKNLDVCTDYLHYTKAYHINMENYYIGPHRQLATINEVSIG